MTSEFSVEQLSSYDNILSRLQSTNLSPWTPSNESSVLEPFTYITSNPGKEIRGSMIEAFNVWLQVPPQRLVIIAKVVSMLHNASLLIDDIEDDSQLRRSQPVAHKIYGVPQTINSANYVYFLALQELSKVPKASSTSDTTQESIPEPSLSQVAGVVLEELLNLHRGQGLDLLWRDNLQCPTEEEYISMVNNKTGGLFRIAIKLMMAYASRNRDVDYVPLVNLIGVLFQIRDDYSNLQSTEYTTNKGFAEDLTEGKFSFPIVHGVRADTSNRQVLNVLQKRPTTPTLKYHIINYLRTHTRSFEYTVNVLRKLEVQTFDEIARLGGNQKLEGIVRVLSIDNSKE